MKTYLAMDMMRSMGVKTPLTSYTYVRINNEDYGLFLAIEEIEEGFARRNYGINYGQIYKSSYRSLEDENLDIKLIYSDDEFNSYRNLFDNAKFKPSDDEKKKVIEAIRVLNQEYVNYPIYTPNKGEIMLERPLFHNLMKNEKIFSRYQELYSEFVNDYFLSGYFENNFDKTALMIEKFVEKDPSAYINIVDHRQGVLTLKEFITLRYKSVKGQLEGDIPATIKGQKANTKSLINADHIKLEDMGEIEDLKDGVK